MRDNIEKITMALDQKKLQVGINPNRMTMIMSEIIGYKIQQIVDNGQAIQIALAEDVLTEPIS